jgi:hypothetical protein
LPEALFAPGQVAVERLRAEQLERNRAEADVFTPSAPRVSARPARTRPVCGPSRAKHDIFPK